MKNLILFILSVLIFLFSCSPDDDLLTQEDLAPGQYLVGEDIWEFRCKVDGVDWYPTSKASSAFSGGLPFSVFHDGLGGGLSITAGKKNNDNKALSTLSLSSKNLEINKPQLPYLNSTYYSDWQQTNEDCISFKILKNDDYNQYANILDRMKKRIEGTFDYKAFNECGDSIIVSDGYFKANYTY